MGVKVVEAEEANKVIKTKDQLIQELEEKLQIEIEEFKKFQDKSVEYQEKREKKIKELQEKIKRKAENEFRENEEVKHFKVEIQTFPK